MFLRDSVSLVGLSQERVSTPTKTERDRCRHLQREGESSLSLGHLGQDVKNCYSFYDLCRNSWRKLGSKSWKEKFASPPFICKFSTFKLNKKSLGVHFKHCVISSESDFPQLRLLREEVRKPFPISA